MTVKTGVGILPDTYFALVKRFPLTHVRDEAHLRAAQDVIDQLLEETLDEGAREYLDALTDLVETYEDVHESIPDASEADVLRTLMDGKPINQRALAKEVGIAQSTISAVLSGDRGLTKEHLLKLAKFFHVSPAVFLPA